VKRSYILYSKIDVGENPVQCIYFLTDVCMAQPFAPGEKGGFYEPTEDDQTRYCKNPGNFPACARLLAYQGHLKAIGLEKD